MRIKRFASLAFPLTLTAFMACSQSGSPLGPEDDASGSAQSQPQTASGSEFAMASSAPEAAVPESQGGETQPVETGTAGSESEAGESSEPGAQSVVDSVLAEVAPSPSEASATPPETGSAAVPSDESAEARGAFKAAIQTPDEGNEDIGSPATASESGSPASPVFLATDFEGEDLSCWNGNRASNGVNRPGCGPYTSIGSAPFALTEGGIARSGRKAVSITYAKNEEAGGANVSLNSDSVNVRAYYYFEPGFDFGQGLKIGRVSSFNSAKQLNDVDIILEVRSSNGVNQCGVTDMRDVGVFFNGAPKGSDWGNATATMAFERGKWYAVEYQVVLNTPGRSDGAVRLWVDEKLVAERLNLSIRGSLSASAKLNVVKIGGWYSNGANGNSCKNPSQPAKLHMDDVTIAASYIGK